MNPINSTSRFKTSFKIIGVTEDSFIESYVAELDEPQIEGDFKNADFFVIIEVLNNDISTDEVADALVETFRKHFYENKDLAPYTRFEESLKFVNDVARDIQTNGLPLYQINVGIAALIDDVVYLSQSNDAEIYLLRGGVVKNIAEGLTVGKRKEHSDLFENIATGTLEKNDVLLFSTARIMRYITQNDLYRLFYPVKDLKSSLENLDSFISPEVLGRIGVLAILFNGINKSTQEIDNEENSSKIKSLFKDNKFDYLKFRRLLKKYFLSLKETSNEFSEILLKFFSGKKIDLKKFKHSNIIKVISVSLIIFLILFVLFFSGFFSSKKTEENKLLSEQIKTIVANAKVEPDKQKAATLVLNAESKLEQIITNKGKKSLILDLQSELEQVKTVVDNLIVIDDQLQLVADISTKRFDVDIKGFLKLGNAYFVHDGKRLYEFINDFVKDPAIILEQGEITAAASFDESESLIFISSDNKLKEYSKGINKFMDTEDGLFKPSNALMSYGSRIYLLDRQAGNIWRYQKRRDSYTKSESALNNVDNEKIKNAVSMTVDGAIYLLYENTDIEKYYAGSLDSAFSVATKPLIKPAAATVIYTELDFPFVLVGDLQSKKIYQYFKDVKTNSLIYQKQYYFAGLNELTSFMVNYQSKRLYVTDKNKVYLTQFLN